MSEHYRIEFIDNLDDEKLKIFTYYLENQLKHYYEPEPGLFIAESPVVIERALYAGYKAVAVLTDELHLEEIKELFDKAESIITSDDIPLYLVSEEVLSGIKGFEMTRGALAAFRRKELPAIADICKGMDCTNRERESVPKLIAVIEEVQNPTNVGAIFRSAAAMGIDAVILTSGSADPLYRRAVRVSMGNVFLVPWTIVDEKQDLVGELKQKGYTTLAMALCDDTVSIAEPILKQQDKLAIFLGTESEGLKEKTIAACDYTVKIPMADGVDSLNVAAASAVAFWELRKEN